ncbi:MAG: translation initiation factor IF-2 [Clostridiales Family XIII bacterium]|nr:translation initiation factor IF-2 [Clostridiales Family XIII bacterium]
MPEQEIAALPEDKTEEPAADITMGETTAETVAEGLPLATGKPEGQPVSETPTPVSAQPDVKAAGDGQPTAPETPGAAAAEPRAPEATADPSGGGDAASGKNEKPETAVSDPVSADIPVEASMPVASSASTASATPAEPGKKPAPAQDAKSEKAHKSGKPKDKKGGKGKEAAKKPEDQKSRPHKKGGKPDRKGGAVTDSRGGKRAPILESRSLEKKPLRSAHRHRPQQKPDQGADSRFENLEPGTVIVNVPITVAGLAEQIEVTTSEIILALMKMGIMANINQNLDEETVELLAIELDVKVVIGVDEGEIIEEGLDEFEDDPEDLVARPPIVTVMGHVDHGKTSLLDAIRKTNVTDREAGGITQHIGASEVYINEHKIVFLDTPGHEAFTAMRARGAHVTDIAVLVVAADDGVMPQTLESVSHAKAAGVPIIVAINKIDKPGANPERVKQELSQHGVVVEDYGGETISVPVSAKTGDGITELLEMILLQADVLELTANPDRLAVGTVIEARLDRNKGPISTVLVLNGTLTRDLSIVAGVTSAKIRTMTDYKGKPIKKAGPATAVEITGFSDVPQAGDKFNALDDDRLAREIAEKRRIRQREQVMAKTSGASLENLFSRIQEGETKELNVVLKADVIGSVGAIAASLEQIDIEGVKVHIIHRGVGTVTESDVMLAGTAGAIIIGFNVRPSTTVMSLSETEGVEIRLYRVIYDVIDEVTSAMKGMLDPEYREVVLGKAEVRETFKVPNIGLVAGCYVQEGKILRNTEIRLVRDGIVIHEGKISSLRRFKDDVREVAQGYECGIGIENFNDIKIADVIEAFMMEEIER